MKDGIRSLSSRLSILVIVAVFLFSTFPQAVARARSARTVKLLRIYGVNLGKHEELIVSNSAQFQTALLTSKAGKTLIVAKEYIPLSVNSVRARAVEDGVPATSVRILRGKSKSIFVYETAEQFHVYSTLGGHLLISKKVQPKFDFSKLILVSDSRRKVAHL